MDGACKRHGGYDNSYESLQEKLMMKDNLEEQIVKADNNRMYLRKIVW